MVTLVFLQKLDSNGIPTSSIQLKILNSLIIDYDTGVTVNPIPQSNDQATILVKAVGNSNVITVSWVVKDSSAVPYISGPAISSQPKTIFDILGFLDQVFQAVSITDRYRIIFADSFSTFSNGAWSQNPPVPTPNPAYYQKDGFNGHVNINFDSGSPVSFTVTVTFQVGTVITSSQTVLPSIPTNFVATPQGSGNVKLSWTAPVIAAGDPSVTGYIIQKSPQFSTSWTTVATVGAVTTYTDNEAVNSVWDYQIAAITANGTGDFTQVFGVTVQ